jgi:hypothetical protein
LLASIIVSTQVPPHIAAQAPPLPLLPLLPPPLLPPLLLPLQLWLRFGLGFAFGRCLGDVAVVAVGVDVE